MTLQASFIIKASDPSWHCKLFLECSMVCVVIAIWVLTCKILLRNNSDADMRDDKIVCSIWLTSKVIFKVSFGQLGELGKWVYLLKFHPLTATIREQLQEIFEQIKEDIMFLSVKGSHWLLCYLQAQRTLAKSWMILRMQWGFDNGISAWLHHSIVDWMVASHLDFLNLI